MKQKQEAFTVQLKCSVCLSCHFLYLLSVIFAFVAWGQPARLLCKQATDYYMLQIGSGIKEQIQSAFRCTRIYYPIWKIIQASGAVLIQRQRAGLINIFKLDQLIISPKATLKSKLDTEGDFICSFLDCLRFEIYCSYSRGQNSPHCTPSPISRSFVINIFSNIVNQNSSWYRSAHLA